MILKLKSKYILGGAAGITVALALFFIFFNDENAEAGWWNDQWQYRKALVINQTYVTADLTDFPVLVSHTDSGYATKIQTDADDIVFTDAMGNRLSHEIESYNSTTGALVAWVKIPALDGDNNSTIYMYYGNASVGSQQNKTAVWDSNYLLVQHLGQSSGNLTDSTTNSFNGVPAGGLTQGGAGKIGACIQGDGTDDKVTVTDSSAMLSPSTLTIEAWVKIPTGWAQYDRIATKKGSLAWNATSGWALEIPDASPTAGNIAPRGSGTTGTSIATGWTAGNWHHMVFTMTGTTASAYRDGVYRNNNTIDTLVQNTEPLTLLHFANESSYLPAYIDEFRVSKVVRSADWIQTSYNNQNDPSTFFSTQSEEVGPGPIGYWSFDEGYGTMAQDGSQNNNDGTITGATWKPESECVSGKCLYFDGSGDNVNVGDIDL